MHDLQISLTVTGSATAIAAVMSAIAAAQGNAASTPTGITIPVGPASPQLPSTEGAAIPHVPSPPMMPPETTGSDDGEASDGSGNDSTGLPWDARIHSTPATKNKDGTWRARRGNDPAMVAQVEAELRSGALTQPPAPPMPAPPPMPPAIPAQPEQPPMMPVPMPNPPAIPTEQPSVAVPPPIPVAPPQPQPEPTPPVADGAITFEMFMDHVMGNFTKINPTDGKPLLHADILEQVVIATSDAWKTPLQAITDVKDHPQMIPWMITYLQSIGRW